MIQSLKIPLSYKNTDSTQFYLYKYRITCFIFKLSKLPTLVL